MAIVVLLLSVVFGSLIDHLGQTKLSKPQCPGSQGVVFVTRLKPGDDLLGGIEAFVQQQQLKSASIVQVTGSVLNATIRFANAENGTVLANGHWEIVSLTGTLSATTGSHVHVAIADESGRVTGGHLLYGSAIYTTAEVTLIEGASLQFKRPLDPSTGYGELSVECVA